MLCINQTAAFIYERQFLKTIRFSNYTFHFHFWSKWNEHFRFSIDLLFKTVFENEISAKLIFSNEKTWNVKDFCVKMNCFEFNIQTTVQKHCWIEFVFRIILFKSWKWKKKFCDFNFRWRSFENEIENLIFHDKKTSNDFIWTFHTSQFISFYQIFCSQVSEINRSNATNQHFDRTVNNLLCSQSVSLQYQQVLDVLFASTDNRWISTLRKNRQNRQCIWSFEVKCSLFDIETIVSRSACI